jgi:cell shape-determining protein MreC
MAFVNNKKPIKYKTNFSPNSKTAVPWLSGYYLKTFVIGVNYAFFVLLSVFMLVYFKRNDRYEKILKKYIIKFATPEIALIDGVNKIFTTADNIYSYIINTKYEIIKLEQDNFNLKQQLMSLNYIKRENEQLKQTVNLASKKGITTYNYKTARLNILSENAYSNSAGISYGSNDNLSEGDLVIDLGGNLIGKIVDLQPNASEILLITNPISKILVKSEKSKMNMIVSGNKSRFLDINYIDGEEYNLKEGEKVFVWGYNDIKTNFDVGIVVKTKRGFKIKINSSFNKIDFGLVILSSIPTDQ